MYHIDNNTIILISFIIGFAVLITIISYICNRPLNFIAYPSVYKDFDITNKRNVNYNNYIEEYIINCYKQYGQYTLTKYSELANKAINIWKQTWLQQIEESFIHKTKYQQRYEIDLKTVEDVNFPIFEFNFYRTHKKNGTYQKILDRKIVKSLPEMQKLFNDLKKISFETTTSKYFQKNQRSLMTRDLRESIMKRDHYTCQLCGKQMFDEVGLHIDHIIPVSKGGKSIPSNLQVLCDKCNLRKSNK